MLGGKGTVRTWREGDDRPCARSWPAVPSTWHVTLLSRCSGHIAIATLLLLASSATSSLSVNQHQQPFNGQFVITSVCIFPSRDNNQGLKKKEDFIDETCFQVPHLLNVWV